MSYKDDDDFKTTLGEEEEEPVEPDLLGDVDETLDDDFGAIIEPDEEGFEEEFSADEDSML